jgi:phosphatidylinositol 4-kinase A
VQATLQVCGLTAYDQSLIFVRYPQKYLAYYDTVLLPETVELGAAVALQFACKIPPNERNIGTSCPCIHMNITDGFGSINVWDYAMDSWPLQGLCKSALCEGKIRWGSWWNALNRVNRYLNSDVVILNLKPRPEASELHLTPPIHTSVEQLELLVKKLKQTAGEIRNKTSSLRMADFKRLLFRSAAALISTKDVSSQHYDVRMTHTHCS